MRNLLLTLSLAIALSGLTLGCTSAHVTGEPQAGIYDLSARGELDRCSPARATGTMGRVGLVTAGDVLSLAIPDPTRGSMLQISLSRPAGYTDDTTVELRGCTAATLDRSFSVLSLSDDAVTVAYHEAWVGMDSCGEAMRSIMPAAPSADCQADLTFEYRLAEACAAPCEVGVLPSGPICLCD